MIRSLLLASLLSSSPVVANAYELPLDHVRLYNTIENMGISIVHNKPSVCWDNRGGGAYFSVAGIIHICQQNATLKSGIVAYTDEDLNTLRHEAHHVVQDCVDGIGDGSLVNIWEGRELREFVRNSSLSPTRVAAIISTYRKQGATDEMILLELETFAVAEDYSPIVIADAIREVCTPTFRF